jgi:N-formylglutamate deformylase
MPPSVSWHVLEGDEASPLIVHVPHAGVEIPPWVRERILLGDEALAAELRHMTDADTDRLAAAAASLAPRRPWCFVNRLSRLVVDPERFPDEREEMIEVGMGAVYTGTSQRGRLRLSDPEHEEALLRAYFHPYADSLAALVDERLNTAGRVCIVDLHSYPKEALPYELHPDRRRPEVCLGTDKDHTPAWLTAAARARLSEIGEVVENEPFAGTYVPLGRYRRGALVASLMVELRRDTYLVDAGASQGAWSLVVAALASLVQDVDALLPVHTARRRRARRGPRP